MTAFKNKKVYLSLAVMLVLITAVFMAWPANGPSLPSPAKAAVATIKNEPAAAQSAAALDKSQYSVNDASSIWAVVNKGRALPSNYVPADLMVPDVPLRTTPADPEMLVRKPAAVAMKNMFEAAKIDGINLKLSSGYRSYSEQISLYGRYAAQSGTALADTFSARPGHSEHQTGLAADIEPLSGKCEVDQCFADLPEGVWLAANAYKYGFIIRYPKGDDSLTGYEYEPWHVRYVGTELADQLKQTGQTLEQFFGLPAYSNYPAESYALKDN